MPSNRPLFVDTLLHNAFFLEHGKHGSRDMPFMTLMAAVDPKRPTNCHIGHCNPLSLKERENRRFELADSGLGSPIVFSVHNTPAIIKLRSLGEN